MSASNGNGVGTQAHDATPTEPLSSRDFDVICSFCPGRSFRMRTLQIADGPVYAFTMPKDWEFKIQPAAIDGVVIAYLACPVCARKGV